jgi:hypothetical protein
MTQEEKDLLLKDLSARLPYGVILNVTLKNKYDKIVNRDIELTDGNLTYITGDSHWIMYKPYLRPMSSMTKEEKLMYEGLMIGTDNVSYMLDVIDWLNKKMFDYRGLIERGLALEAPRGMYN